MTNPVHLFLIGTKSVVSCNIHNMGACVVTVTVTSVRPTLRWCDLLHQEILGICECREDSLYISLDWPSQCLMSSTF